MSEKQPLEPYEWKRCSIGCLENHSCRRRHPRSLQLPGAQPPGGNLASSRPLGIDPHASFSHFIICPAGPEPLPSTEQAHRENRNLSYAPVMEVRETLHL